jgi:hypothetical protein
VLFWQRPHNLLRKVEKRRANAVAKKATRTLRSLRPINPPQHILHNASSMARTKVTAKRKAEKEKIPPLRSSSMKKKRKAESPVASPPKKKAAKANKKAAPSKTPPCSPKALSALAVRSSPRLKAMKKTGPILPTQSTKEAKSRAKVVKDTQEEVFPGLQTAAPSSTGSEGAHFTVQEYEIICKAYVRVSLCSKKSTNRKGTTFWKEIHTGSKETMKANKIPLICDVASMKNRFKKINSVVLAFKAMYKIAKKQPVSGWNEDMYKKHALEMWEQNEGSPYMFLECLKVMKGIPKYDWDAKPRKEGEENLLGMDAPMGGNMVWTMGTKKAKAIDAKAKIKKYQSTADSSLAVDNGIMQSIAASFEKHTEVTISMDRWQMLLIQLHYFERQGNQQEANRVLKEILDITVAKPVQRHVAMDMPVPPSVDFATIDLQDNELVSAADSSSSSNSIPPYQPEGNLKDDNNYNSEASELDEDEDDDDDHSQSGENSGGDPNPRRQADV